MLTGISISCHLSNMLPLYLYLAMPGWGAEARREGFRRGGEGGQENGHKSINLGAPRWEEEGI